MLAQHMRLVAHGCARANSHGGLAHRGHSGSEVCSKWSFRGQCCYRLLLVVQVLIYLRVHATPSPQQHANLSASLTMAGAGVIVGAGVDEELAALSFNTLRATLELRASDVRVAGSLQAVQIDDQSLDALQPVVLGPAGVVTKGASRHLRPPFTASGCLFRARMKDMPPLTLAYESV